jgi:hypothetical protein
VGQVKTTVWPVCATLNTGNFVMLLLNTLPALSKV